MTLLIDLANYIADNTSYELQKDIWIGDMPEKYNNCIAIYQTGGVKDDTGTSNLRQPTIQILVRNKSYLEAYNISYEIHTLLHRLNNVEMTDTSIMHIHNLQEPQEIAKEEMKGFTRSLFSCNYHIWTR